MSDFNPITGEHDIGIVAMIGAHIEVPLRSLVALESSLCQQLQFESARSIARGASENGVVDLVTSALALITASWEQAGANFGIGPDAPPEVDAWCEQVLDAALAAASLRFHLLRVDYAVNIGPIPNVGG